MEILTAKKTDNLSGVNDAAKSIFSIFKLLAQRQKLEFFNQPEGILEKQICLDAFNFKECKNFQIDEVIQGYI